MPGFVRFAKPASSLRRCTPEELTNHVDTRCLPTLGILPGRRSERAEEGVGDRDRCAAGLPALDQHGEGDVAGRSAELVSDEPAVRVRRGLVAVLGGAGLAVDLAAVAERGRRA